MKVNFNALRLKIQQVYNELACQVDVERHDDFVIPLQDLRQLIFGLMCLYSDDDPLFSDLSSQVDLIDFSEEEI